MKTFLSITTAIILLNGSAQLIAQAEVTPPVIPSKGLMAAQAALPLVTMVAQQTASTFGSAMTSAVASLGTKSLRCNVCNSVACKVPGPTFDVCKSMCQEKVPIAGFEIKIRYADNWSIYECVKSGNKRTKGTETKAGYEQKMDKLTSIAVYSEYDRAYVEGILSKLYAAGTILAKNGYIQGLNDGNRADGLAQAKEAQKILTNSLQQRAYWGYLGPQ